MAIPGLTHFNIAHLPQEVYQLIGLIMAFIIGVIAYVIYLHRANRHTSFKILSVTLPEILEEDQHKYRQKMEGVFSALHRLIFSQTDKLFIEILKVDSYITIQIGSNSTSVIEKMKGIISQIENVQLVEVETDQLSKLTSIVGKKVVTTKPYYPLGKNDNLFASILHFMASLKENQQGGMQITLRGVVKKEAIKSQIQTLEERSKQNNRRPTETENYETAQYQLKLQNNLFKVKINVFGIESFIPDSLVSLLQTLNLDTNTFTSSFEKPENIRSRYVSPETIITPFVRKGQGSYLTATELSYFLHPVPVVRGTYSSRQTKTLEASPEFLASNKENIKIGTAETGENSSQSIYFPIRNLQRHLYVVGKTGRGKSTFLTTLISGLVNKEVGSVFVFDPHGELLLDIIQAVRKTDNIVYLNIEDKSKVFTFNPLFAFQKNTFEKASIRDALLEIVQSETSDIAGQNSGVATYQRIKQILEIGIDFADAYYVWLTEKGVSPEAATILVNEKQLTLNDLPMLLIKEMGYIPLLKAIYKDQTTPTALYVNKLLDKHANNQMVVEAVQTRLEQLLHPSIRLISEGNKLQLDKMVETNKAFLLPITENVYGTKGERALLQSILSGLWLVKRKNREKRTDTYVFIDECQRGQINAIPKIIAEARKYRLFLGLSNQQLGQLKEEVKTAILGNMGTLVSFTVAADDTGAQKLAPFFGSHVREKDLANLPKYKAYLRTEGNEAKPQVTFSFNTVAPEASTTHTNSKTININSLKEYGENTEMIEKRLTKKQTDPSGYFLNVL